MRIHSDTLIRGDFFDACRSLECYVDDFSQHGSRSRANGFKVYLGGSSKRLAAHWTEGYGYATAATYDEWGWFLSHLFDVDSDMIAGPYRSYEDFHVKTEHRFA